MNIDRFPRQPLLFGPSPTQRLARLTEHLGGPQIWAKREDCNSGLAEIGPDSNVLYAHLGGAPALSAYGARVN